MESEHNRHEKPRKNETSGVSWGGRGDGGKPGAGGKIRKGEPDRPIQLGGVNHWVQRGKDGLWEEVGRAKKLMGEQKKDKRVRSEKISRRKKGDVFKRLGR